MKFLKAKWNSWRRRAKWLILWCIAYIIPASIMIALDISEWDELGHMGPRWDAYGMYLQWAWLILMGSPLFIKPLGNWVFMREKKS